MHRKEQTTGHVQVLSNKGFMKTTPVKDPCSISLHLSSLVLSPKAKLEGARL